jgi:hypothetical protein
LSSFTVFTASGRKSSSFTALRRQPPARDPSGNAPDRYYCVVQWLIISIDVGQRAADPDPAAFAGQIGVVGNVACKHSL